MPDRLWGARVVLAWVRCYTAALPVPVAVARRNELMSDVHDQVADGAAGGLSSWRLSWALVGRMVRGLSGDLVWRAEREAELTGRHVAVARPDAVVVGLVALALPFWFVAETKLANAEWSEVVAEPAWRIACVLWAVTISYTVIALVYVVRHARRR